MSNFRDYTSAVLVKQILPSQTLNTDADINSIVFDISGCKTIDIRLFCSSFTAGKISFKSIKFASDVNITQDIRIFDNTTIDAFTPNNPSIALDAISQASLQGVGSTKIVIPNKSLGIQKYAKVTFTTSLSANLVANAMVLLGGFHDDPIVQA